MAKVTQRGPTVLCTCIGCKFIVAQTADEYGEVYYGCSKVKRNKVVSIGLGTFTPTWCPLLVDMLHKETLKAEQRELERLRNGG